MNSEYFILEADLPKHLRLGSRKINRSDLITEITEDASFDLEDFLGIQEGELRPSEPSFEVGNEQEDPFENCALTTTQIYFSSEEGAKAAQRNLEDQLGQSFRLLKMADQNWNQKWNESFQGSLIPPYWEILPPHLKTSPQSTYPKILINPGMGFGSGTHPTTRLCLEFLGESPCRKGDRVLDFGSGSGILAIAAALQGASVDAVEIDEAAIENALECASLNQVRISFSKELTSPAKTYDLIMANILSSVLTQFADVLIAHLKAGGTLVLSGLLEKDLPDILKAYAHHPHLQEFYDLKREGEWHRITFWGQA